MQSLLLKNKQKGAIKRVKYKAFLFILGFLSCHDDFYLLFDAFPLGTQVLMGKWTLADARRTAHRATGLPLLPNARPVGSALGKGWKAKPGISTFHSPGAPTYCKWVTPKPKVRGPV